jgi:carbohydrate kinase (thermoresistant glucokinase family)
MSSTRAAASGWADGPAADQGDMQPERPLAPARILVMGVCGSGKSTVGQALARALGLPYVEGDELHPRDNVARMAAGIPLTDDDRRGWLDAVAARLDDAAAHAQGAVVACSALKRAYRDRLRLAAPDLRVVWLHGDETLLARRLAGRAGHYMPPSLLPSQLATLEPPHPDESALAVDIGQPPDALVQGLVDQLQEHAA